ncbi:glycosyltransferase [Aliarcobacter butzleri]|uniref:glycosyltransferase n=1 Tax=Aliarcobacter butzleri TaxID=28197 RepID=UPI001EDA0876|nr:glycosyltransferase [Aliarcobacter butzleri]MCG3706278.1 glycosyltransferase [Aliarcobacter butzleri]MDN5078069.1 glycosyltransferase [Aliarcobacter butzleri]MDN5119397.1 glycosyltransferase [Aliarcobacter butzleri]
MKTTISYKTTNILIEKLKKQENIEVISNKGFLKKLFNNKKYADVYFHSGSLDEKSIKNIKNSKITIVNSFSIKNKILEELKISSEKIEVIYPSININIENEDKIKIDFYKKFNIDFNTKLIFFTAKNFKTSGIKEFLDICSNLNYSNFKIIIAGDKRQIGSLQFSLPKYKKLEEKIILIDDYKNFDELFLVSDIFLLPTHNKSFATNILKAMFCKCVVFLSIKNDAKEVIDVFASMSSPTDATIAFKIDAILLDEKELENIKEQNNKLAKECSIENNLKRFNEEISNI